MSCKPLHALPLEFLVSHAPTPPPPLLLSLSLFLSLSLSLSRARAPEYVWTCLFRILGEIKAKSSASNSRQPTTGATVATTTIMGPDMQALLLHYTPDELSQYQLQATPSSESHDGHAATAETAWGQFEDADGSSFDGSSPSTRSRNNAGTNRSPASGVAPRSAESWGVVHQRRLVRMRVLKCTL
jgi:hypothetical protein